MWNFIKNVFAVVTALFVFTILSIIGLIIIISISSEGEEKIKAESVLKLKLDKEIVDDVRNQFPFWKDAEHFMIMPKDQEAE